MNQRYYSTDRNVQILLYTLKKNNIRNVIVSPGSNNKPIVVSMQSDPFFKLYSCVDERSAAYMAIGLSEELCEPVIISCTGATASRNYMPGLTEAYYRNVPIIAISSTLSTDKHDHLMPQVINQSVIPSDISYSKITLPSIKNTYDENLCELKINQVLVDLNNKGRGPIYIEIETSKSDNFINGDIPSCRIINKIMMSNKDMPKLPCGKTVILIGSHSKWDNKLVALIDRFCEEHNAVVFCDHSSSFNGKYKISYSLLSCQKNAREKISERIELVIHIGGVIGESYNICNNVQNIWRVHPDGKFKDPFNKLQTVFEMDETVFFERYVSNLCSLNITNYIELKEEYNRLYSGIPDLPFSNIWVAHNLSKSLPNNSFLHLGILNSFLSWNYFEIDPSIQSTANVGAFGIDGCLSSLIGASLANDKKMYISVLGDLAFEYDLNSIGNRHINKNIRILLINNDGGSHCNSFKYPVDKKEFIAAAGHFNRGKFVEKIANVLGFDYMKASNKEEFETQKELFLNTNTSNPIIFEILTDNDEEALALSIIQNLRYR